MSGGNPHPLASDGTFRPKLFFNHQDREPIFELAIHGSYVAFLQSGYWYRWEESLTALTIWDWRTGAVVSVSTSFEPRSDYVLTIPPSTCSKMTPRHRSLSSGTTRFASSTAKINVDVLRP